MGPGADLVLALCTTALVSTKFEELLLNFSPGAAGHNRPSDSLRGISLSRSEYVFFRGSPVLLLVLTGNLILVAGRVVARTGMGL